MKTLITAYIQRKLDWIVLQRLGIITDRVVTRRISVAAGRDRTRGSQVTSACVGRRKVCDNVTGLGGRYK